jgi:hypothetical protein
LKKLTTIGGKRADLEGSALYYLATKREEAQKHSYQLRRVRAYRVAAIAKVAYLYGL